jgi:hypothetical protein
VRRVWTLRFFALICLSAPLVFGQGATGTITGTVSDPAGLVIAGANVQATNTETGGVYTGASTGAGNYTISNLPVGTYNLTATVQGFKTYNHTGLVVEAAQTIRENITMQVGATTESVTVEAQASLLKTESGDLTHNVTLEQMDDLPLLGIGDLNAGTSGYRNPFNTLQTLPGVSGYQSSGTFTINGLGGGPSLAPPLTETMRTDGLDTTSRLFNTYDYTQIAQPNADAIQEIAYQTSNYAPEFGQAGSVVINMTTKSGTNQFHGSGFDYFVNEDLNAGDPFSVNTSGVGKVRQVNRRNDFGGTLGGPVFIPKIYNGKDKTFFFFSYEQFLEHQSYGFSDTVPLPAFLQGNFSAISPNGNCSLCAANGIPTTPLGGSNYRDPNGALMYANEIYDPLTRGTVNGQGYALPFPGNIIPQSRFAASSVAFQALFPAAQNGNLVGNYAGIIGGNRYSAIPGFRIDQIISSKDKVSFYWSRNNTESQISSPLGNADGLPTEIGGYRGTFIPSTTITFNYDRTLTPTVLFHFGAGYLYTSFSDRAPFLNFDPSQFDLSGFILHRQFPTVSGMCVAAPFGGVGCSQGAGGGGMQTIGTAAQIQSQNYEEKPSYNANLTWVKGNHTYKAGAELYFENTIGGSYAGVTLATGTGPTSEPFVPTVSFNGLTTGYGYASFLLGDYGPNNSVFPPGSGGTTQSPNEIFTHEGSETWGLFIQDSWKVTRKLTVTYGARWDYDTPEREQYGRLGQFDPNISNGNAGGFPGATAYASTCNCAFYKAAYPFALGPRVGVAYQITPKTVFRGGWGFNYQFVANPAGTTIGTNGIYPLAGINPYVNIATPGSIVTPTWPVTNPNVYPNPGTLGAAGSFFGPASEPTAIDENENRPPRINQFSVGIQRQITNNFILEASYVANRAAWLSGGPYGYLSQISPQQYASYGLYPYPGTGPCSSGGGVCASTTYNNYNDYLLLQQPISSPAVINAMAARGRTQLYPYTGFPGSGTLQDSLYAFPQFPGITDTYSPTGDSKYDSLQIKATKRFSHGLQAGGTFTWGQGFITPSLATPVNGSNAEQDFFNPNSARWQLQTIPPRVLNFNAVYTTQKASFLPKWANFITKDWQIGWFANYQSGAFLTPPVSTTLNYLPSEEIRVPGQPLYTPGVNINNLSSYSPYYTQVLNPNAWEPCPANAVCAAQSVLYKDFRGPRIPTEDGSIGRHFRMGPEGKFDLFVRAEFVNIFNRTLMPPPSTSVSPQLPVSTNGSGILVGGFGVIDAYSSPGSYYTPPTGTFYLQPRTGTIVARFSF